MPTKFFNTVRPKLFDRKMWYHPPPPPLFIHKIFRNQKFSQKKQDYLTKFSSTVKQKFWLKIVIPPPLLIHKIIFPTRNFLKHRMLPWRSFFGPVRWKKFDKTVKFPPAFARNFSIPEFSRNTEVFSYEFYRHCEQKIFQQFNDIPFLCIKFFDNRNFPIHRSIPQQNFSGLWDKKLERKVVIPPSFAWNIEISGGIDVCRKLS